MKYKISFLILGIIILFIGCSDSKSSKRSNNVVEIKNCLDSIYSSLKNLTIPSKQFKKWT